MPQLELPRRDQSPPPKFIALPKVDLHSHSEAVPWLDRVLAGQRGGQAHDFQEDVARVRRDLPPSLERLRAIALALDMPALEALDQRPEYLTARFEAHMEEAASAGALLLEIKVGGDVPFLPHFASSFREAESRVQHRHAGFVAQPLLTFSMNFDRPTLASRADQVLNIRDSLAGVDFIPHPYDDEADFGPMRAFAARFSAAGLGITCHAGEFSAANLRGALSLPGLTRLGHAAFAESVPSALDEIARREILVEICITGNVALGTVDRYEDHHLRRFLDAGVRVALGSDNPVKIYTTIAHEYWYASQLGLSRNELLQLTRWGIDYAFTSEAKKAALHRNLQA